MECREGHDLLDEGYLEEGGCLYCRINNLEQAIKRAIEWFKNFGYNSFGIACQDDVEDHSTVLTELEEVIK